MAATTTTTTNATTTMAVFETALGRCGIAWASGAVTSIQWPEPTLTKARARLRARLPEAAFAEPPPRIARTIARIVAALRGESVALSGVALALHDVPALDRTIYARVRAIPRGTTLACDALAAELGATRRAVAQALARNPWPIVVPCHRVIDAGLRPDDDVRARLLAAEGVAATRRPPDKVKPPVPVDATAAIDHLRAVDPKFARLIDVVGPCTLAVQPETSTFAALARSIVYQQLHGRAAATIFARLCAATSGRADAAPTAEAVLALDEARLRAAGLSGSKLAGLRDLAARTVRGEIPELAALRGMTDDAIIDRLTAVRGIGRWSVEMLLMFRLGRPDVLPVDDFGVRKGLGRLLGKREMPTRDELARRGARWQPHRTIASWYLWRATELATDVRL
jgi:methylated-DNA-[protein]-cysteine S-methyltransferase